MKTLPQRILSAALLGIATVALYAQSGTPIPDPAAGKQGIKTQPAQHVNPAERAFQTNCSRCHNAPESLSPRITGTIVRHMRVRANLSAEEERLILSYFNP